jgi:hypothetical protein
LPSAANCVPTPTLLCDLSESNNRLLAGDGELLKVGIALLSDTESVTIGLVLPLQLAVHEAGDHDTGQQED